VKFRDYYEVMGVPRTATTSEIKTAYRRLARTHHPDLQPTDKRAAAAERFKEIGEAYAVLGDPERRREYDALGESWRNGQDFTPPPGAEAQGRRGADAGEGFGDFSDFFASMFGRGRGPGGPSGGARANVRVAVPGRDIEAEIPVTIDEMLRGGTRRMSVDGSRSLEVRIPKGVRSGTVLRLAGEGEPGYGEGPPGDLYLRVRPIDRPPFRVAGDDLEMDLPLWPWQAVLGAEVQVPTPDGPVTLKVPPVTQAGRRLRLRGQGLPKTDGGRGDLNAVVKIMVPERPSASERKGYEALKRDASAPADRPAGEAA
jgi:curved DNA-binding protein